MQLAMQRAAGWEIAIESNLSPTLSSYQLPMHKVITCTSCTNGRAWEITIEVSLRSCQGICSAYYAPANMPTANPIVCRSNQYNQSELKGKFRCNWVHSLKNSTGKYHKSHIREKNPAYNKSLPQVSLFQPLAESGMFSPFQQFC